MAAKEKNLIFLLFRIDPQGTVIKEATQRKTTGGISSFGKGRGRKGKLLVVSVVLAKEGEEKARNPFGVSVKRKINDEKCCISSRVVTVLLFLVLRL